MKYLLLTILFIFICKILIYVNISIDERNKDSKCINYQHGSLIKFTGVVLNTTHTYSTISYKYFDNVYKCFDEEILNINTYIEIYVDIPNYERCTTCKHILKTHPPTYIGFLLILIFKLGIFCFIISCGILLNLKIIVEIPS